MSIFFGNDNTTYTSLKSISEREDAKVWVQATAEVSCTAYQGKVLRIGQNGWIAYGVFDTSLASITANGRVGFKVGVSPVAIPSGSDGWFQVGGYCEFTGDASQSTTTGNVWRWTDATLTGNLITAASFSQAGLCDSFAIAMTTATAATFSLFLMNKWVVGST